ncbi:MAG: flavin reductase family protein [Promethearchaeota archaeon]
MNFKKIEVEEITDNVFKLINKDWALIAAGSKENYNMMTASWAGLGILWNKKVVFIFIRPTRYTYEFLEKSEYFSINFFGEEYRSILNFCGTKSGRDVNKMKEARLTPIEEKETIYFKESRLTMVCKKLYYQDLMPEHFLDSHIKSHYDKNDYHRMYVGEVVQCLKK